MSTMLDVRAKQRRQPVSRLVAENLPPRPSEEEVGQRIQDVRSGKVNGIPVLEVIRQAHELAGIRAKTPKQQRTPRVANLIGTHPPQSLTAEQQADTWTESLGAY